MCLVSTEIKRFIPNKSTCRLFALLINLARIVLVYREYKANHVISSQVTWLITSHVDVTHHQLKRFWLASHNFGKHEVFVIFQYRYLFWAILPWHCYDLHLLLSNTWHKISILNKRYNIFANTCFNWHNLGLG